MRFAVLLPRSTVRFAVLLLLATSCSCGSPASSGGAGAAASDPDGESDSGTDAGGEDSGDEGGGSGGSGGSVDIEAPAPALSAEEVGAALEEVLAGGIPDPTAARKLYMERFEGREEGCPGNSYSLQGNFEGCHTSEGWVYAGVAEYTGNDFPDDTSKEFHLLGDGFITDPDGNRMIFGGELDYTPTGGGWEGSITGTWSWPLAEGWMQPEQGGGILDLRVHRLDGDGWEVIASGTIGGQAWPVSLVDTSAISDLCGGEPTGTFRVRGEGGYWYELVLEEESCGCGPVVYAGEVELGEACPELGAAYSELAEVGID